MDRIRALGCWKGPVEIAPLTGGLSNESWKVTDGGESFVVRFGQDYPSHHVDRRREAMVARAAHAAGLAPEVILDAPGVMVSRFLEARTWTVDDMRAAPERLGALLRRFHQAMPALVSGPGFAFWVFHVIRDYARTITAGGSSFAADCARYLSLAAELEAAQVPLPIIFGHHDMLPGNVLDDGARLWLIDFEYAGFGTAMFDLAGSASNAGMTDDQSGRLLSAYFGGPPDPATRRAFAAMQCASLLREAMWAMVSDLYLTTPGVDFRAYARENLDRLDTALDRHRALQEKPGK